MDEKIIHHTSSKYIDLLISLFIAFVLITELAIYFRYIAIALYSFPYLLLLSFILCLIISHYILVIIHEVTHYLCSKFCNQKVSINLSKSILYPIKANYPKGENITKSSLNLIYSSPFIIISCLLFLKDIIFPTIIIELSTISFLLHLGLCNKDLSKILFVDKIYNEGDTIIYQGNESYIIK